MKKVNSYTLINLTDKNQGDISCINFAQSNLWTGRLDSETDPTQFRHFQTVKFGDLSQLDFSDEHKGVGLLGYAIDKGVELNKGRVGAKRRSQCH